jgi:hypothetical protein
MKSKQWIAFYLSAVMMLAMFSYADMVSWVDENGIRHYSNIEGSSEAGKSKIVDEYKSQPENKKTYNSKERFKVLDIYNKQNEKYREKKEQQQYEWNQRKAKERAAEKAANRCADAKDKLEKLRTAGWKNYVAREANSITCPDRVWTNRRGEMQNNMGPCMARKNIARMNAYKRAIHLYEMAVRGACE